VLAAAVEDVEDLHTGNCTHGVELPKSQLKEIIPITFTAATDKVVLLYHVECCVYHLPTHIQMHNTS